MIEYDHQAFAKAAEEDLASLKADAEELQRRHSEKTRQLEDLQKAPKKDFTKIVELEGQRQAIAKLLEEQRFSVQHAEGVLADIQRRGLEAKRWQVIDSTAHEIGVVHAEYHQLFSELKTQVQSMFERLTELDKRWLLLRQTWRTEAAHLGYYLANNVQGQERANVFFHEADSLKINTDLLRLSRPHMDPLPGGRYENSLLPFGSPRTYEQLVHNFLLNAYESTFRVRLGQPGALEEFKE